MKNRRPDAQTPRRPVTQTPSHPAGKLGNWETGKLGNWETGFTLIELMLVVIIISILAAMISPRLSGRSEQARQSVAKTDIEASLSLALDLYEMDMGHYPQSLDALKSKPAGEDNWKGPYIKKKSLDPWSRNYVYKFPGEHNPSSYDLSSLGADGKAGTQDDVVNWEEH
ncbi:MAG: type II secretion system major pseudopilin GspG [Candidatus Omnitrophica bacterium]|nr:type II secretion system major pseudopilin GspG [Candidatus Omnitrophota bacterium]